MTLRMTLAMVIALSAYAAAGMPAVEVTSLSQLVLLVIVEVVTGGASALAARILLESAATAGHIAGLGTGMGYASMLDPISGTESNATGQLFTVVGLAFAVALGVHKDAIAMLLWSVRDGSLSPVVDVQTALRHLITASLSSIVVGIKLGFPILCAATFGHLSLGVLGRAAPQLSLQSLGFSAAVLSGAYALYLVVPEAGYAAAALARTALATP
jgi:flagellar biosynthetic protein FliR